MLLSGKPLSNSTQASLNKSNIKPIPKKKDNFFVFVCKQSWNLIMGLWMRFRKFMWIGSTGFIIMVIPFVFAYMQEMQNEIMRLNDLQNGNRVI